MHLLLSKDHEASAKALNSSILTGRPAKSTGIIPLKNPFGFDSINSFTELISNK
jgi:hypothetical protein